MKLILILFLIATIKAQNKIKKYDGNDFKKLVPLQNHFVFYFAPWCGECKTIAGIWEELAFKTEDVSFAKVDCQKQVDLCAYQDVSSYPTLKLYKTGGDAMGIRYRGVEDLQSIEQFMNGHLGKEGFIFGSRTHTIPEPDAGLHTLQDENFDDAMASVSKAFVKFCTPWSSKCMDLEPIWGNVAKEFRFEDDFLIGSVDCSMSKSTCNENDVRGYPSLLWIVDGVVSEKYTKPRTEQEIKQFIMNKLDKKETLKVPKNYQEEKDPTDVVHLNETSFKDQISMESRFTFVQYWTAWCSECLLMDTAWEGLAAEFNDRPDEAGITIATVDCVLNKVICVEMGVADFPTLNLYKGGKLVGDYKGERGLKEMLLFVHDLLNKNKKEL